MTFGDQLRSHLEHGSSAMPDYDYGPAVVAGVRRRRRRRLAAGVAAAGAATAVALVVAPGGPILEVQPTQPAASDTSVELDNAQVERQILALPVGGVPDGVSLDERIPGAPTVDKASEPWALVYRDGRRVELPPDTETVAVIRQDVFGTILEGSIAPVAPGSTRAPGAGAAGSTQFTMSVPPGAATGTVYRETTQGILGAVSPDGQRVTVDRPAGGVDIVDRATGRVVGGVPVTACENQGIPSSVTWAAPGLVIDCARGDQEAARTLRLVDVDNGKTLRRWAVPLNDAGWDRNQDGSRLLHWDLRAQKITVHDAATGTVVAERHVNSRSAMPEFNADRSVLVLGSALLTTDTLEPAGSLPGWADEAGWEWRGDWLLGGLTLIRYLGEHGEAVPTGVKRDDRYYFVLCRADGTQCHRLPTDPKKSPTGRVELTSSVAATATGR